MAEVGVVLKVPQPTHTRFKDACAKHDRSMQKVLLSLIEGWVANGAPDPGAYGRKTEASNLNITQDLKARQAIVDLASELKKLQDRLEALEHSSQPAPVNRPAFDAFCDALRQAASEEVAQGTGAVVA